MKNVIIFCEIAARELDSKVLLAAHAAKAGMRVYLSDIGSIRYLLEKKSLPRGIFHGKSLNPRAGARRFRSELLAQGFKITSIDEEHGLLDFDYESFADKRFSDDSIGQAELVFCWGPHDQRFLAEKFKNHTDKFIMTGSPRVDIWRYPLADAMLEHKVSSIGDYILIPTNFGTANNRVGLEKLIKSQNARAQATTKENVAHTLKAAAEQYEAILEFSNVIDIISDEFPSLNIVVRPHPVEKQELWEEILPKKKNIHIERDGDIAVWVKGASAILHNGCTTALECAVIGTPIITYQPNKNASTEREYPNTFGIKCQSSDEVTSIVKEVLSGSSSEIYRSSCADKVKISERIYASEEKLAAENIAQAWESISIPHSPSVSHYKMTTLLWILKVKRYFKRLLGMPDARSWKFTDEEAKTVIHKATKAARIWDANVECKRLGSRLFVFERVK